MQQERRDVRRVSIAHVQRIAVHRYYQSIPALSLFQDDMPSFSTGLHVLGGWPMVIILSIVLSLSAVVGDLAESILKRSLSVKDSGHVLPGIGGD